MVWPVLLTDLHLFVITMSEANLSFLSTQRAFLCGSTCSPRHWLQRLWVQVPGDEEWKYRHCAVWISDHFGSHTSADGSSCILRNAWSWLTAQQLYFIFPSKLIAAMWEKVSFMNKHRACSILVLSSVLADLITNRQLWVCQFTSGIIMGLHRCLK